MIREMRKKGIIKGVSATCLFLALLGLALRRIGAGGNFVSVALVLTGGLAVRQWVVVLTQSFLKGIKEFCDQTSSSALTMQWVERAWSGGTRISKYCRMDARYLVWGNGVRSAVIPLEEIGRMEIDTDARVRNWVLRLGLKNGTIRAIVLEPMRSSARKQELKRLVFAHMTAHRPAVVFDEDSLPEEVAGGRVSGSSKAGLVIALVLVVAVAAGAFYFAVLRPGADPAPAPDHILVPDSIAEPGAEIDTVIYEVGREAIEIVEAYIHGHMTNSEADQALRQLGGYFPTGLDLLELTDDESAIHWHILRMREVLRNDERKDEIPRYRDRLGAIMDGAHN